MQKKSFILKWIMFFGLVSSTATPTVIRTRVPSESAGAEGLTVRIDLPDRPRYGGTGAPVVVYMGGGFRGDCLNELETGLDDHGFIEIRFNFPGSGIGKDSSGGGPYDHRGPVSLVAARDVIRFCMDLTDDSSGRTLSEIIHPIVPLPGNVGLIGSSNGGNTNICVAGVHGHDLPGLAWILNLESPVGDGMPQAEAGAKTEGNLRPFNPETNDAYDPATGQWDLSSLTFDPLIRIPILDNTQQYIKGDLYFDFNGDGKVDLGSDFIVYPLVFSFNGQLKSFYSERLRNEAEAKNLFPDPTPNHVPAIEETHNFWYWRNGDYWIDSVIVKNPDLLFMIVANDTDHVQRSPDHPHVLNQYNRFMKTKCRFIRLNPDLVYIEEMIGIAPPGTADNDAFMTLDATNIQNAVEPGNAKNHFGKVVIVATGACELADRTQYNVMDINLSSLLTSVDQRSQMIQTLILEQNYPNPFNPRTTIKYYLLRSMHVRLTIYNINGQEITTLVDDHRKAGFHTTIWNSKDNQGTHIGSGVYLFRITADNYTKVRKMLLVR